MRTQHPDRPQPRTRGRLTLLASAALVALVGVAAFPAPALAHGEEAPAGGASAEEVIVAGIVGALFLALAVVLLVVRRKGRVAPVERVGDAVGRVMRIPGWAAVPLAVAGASLVVAVFGFYWDVATHIDHGRDEGVFGNPAHWPILVGLVGIAVAGMLSLLLGSDEDRPGAFSLKEGWRVPIGGLLLLLCGFIAMIGFPIDDVWHRIFGQDVTLWSPPHIQMVAGASLCTLGLWVLFVEAERADPERMSSRFHHWLEVLIAGAVLIGMSTLQGEFDFGVPQFNQVFHPVLIAIAAGIALVPARTRLGAGGALKAVGFFLALRIVITVFVTGAFDHLMFHFPLYLGAAVAVELAARFVNPERQLSLGALGGIGIGTLGLAVETVWVNVWYPTPWTSALLPEAIVLAVPAAVAAGLVGGFFARALASPATPRQTVPSALAPAAALVIVIALAYPLPSDSVGGEAQMELEPVETGGGESVHATIQLDPPDLADDARWFQLMAWQGADWWSEDHTRYHDLEPIGEGQYRTTEPVPVHGNWKAMIRLHRDRALAAVPIFLPEDPAIPAEEVPAEAQMTREFVPDEEILLREMRPAPAWVDTFAHLAMLVIAVAWVAAFIWGTRRLRLAAPMESRSGTRVDDRESVAH
jgi:hypothetical protein